jgi:hypothetical protein
MEIDIRKLREQFAVRWSRQFGKTKAATLLHISVRAFTVIFTKINFKTRKKLPPPKYSLGELLFKVRTKGTDDANTPFFSLTVA